MSMMIAKVPAVFLGNALISRVAMRLVHLVAALLFIGIGLWLFVQLF